MQLHTIFAYSPKQEIVMKAVLFAFLLTASATAANAGDALRDNTSVTQKLASASASPNYTSGPKSNSTRSNNIMLACKSQHSTCKQDSDCCSGYICISLKCE
uniref:Dickkopf N-terminal cysteine-rich domain-containing protein n=1 Tax=Xanthobacter autotrophicus TaxID=280 RepID=UPI00372D0536